MHPGATASTQPDQHRPVAVLRRSRRGPAGRRDEARLAACREAAGLYHGELAEGAGYEWAEPYAGTARRTLSLLEARLTDLGITPGTQTRHVAASLLGTGPVPDRL